MLNVIANWRREREAVRELSRLSDRELADLGIARSDIRAVAESAVVARDEAVTTKTLRGLGEVDGMAPAWGARARPPLAA